jgi:hypothetical protein
MIDYSQTYFSDLAQLHGFNTKECVKRYCENTIDVAGNLLQQAGIDLDNFKGKILPVKLVVFLRKINPTWEDLMDENLKRVTLNQLFPDKFPDLTHDTPQTPPSLPLNSEIDI